MSRLTNARIAGVTFLAYIAAGITQMLLNARATAGTDVAGRLASIAQHGGDVRYSMRDGGGLLCAGAGRDALRYHVRRGPRPGNARHLPCRRQPATAGPNWPQIN